MRLSWLGTGRLTWNELAAVIWDALGDEGSPLWRSMNPESIPLEHRVRMDQVNVAWLQLVTFRQANGDKKSKFEPLYRYEGGPWQEAAKVKKDLLGGFQYKRMKPSEAVDWMTKKLQREAEVAARMAEQQNTD